MTAESDRQRKQIEGKIKDKNISKYEKTYFAEEPEYVHTWSMGKLRSVLPLQSPER